MYRHWSAGRAGQAAGPEHLNIYIKLSLAHHLTSSHFAAFPSKQAGSCLRRAETACGGMNRLASPHRQEPFDR